MEREIQMSEVKIRTEKCATQVLYDIKYIKTMFNSIKIPYELDGENIYIPSIKDKRYIVFNEGVFSSSVWCLKKLVDDTFAITGTVKHIVSFAVFSYRNQI